MKSRKMLIITVVLLILIVPLLINLIYSATLDRSYTDLDNYHVANYSIDKIPHNGTLEFVHTDLSADYVSFIYLDTLNLNFKIAIKTYVGDHDEETDYISFDKTGKVIETDKFIPRQTDTTYHIDRITINGAGQTIRSDKAVNTSTIDNSKNCITLNGLLPPWPKWKNRSSPIYIKHFSPRRLNLSELNPFKIGGINGSPHKSIWYGSAYCDVKFNNEVLKIKVPFGHDHLILGINDYYADLQYYLLPVAYAKVLPVGFLKLDNDIYLIKIK